MARIRTIKPEFFMSEDIGELTVISRLLFVALWCHADREGRMKYQRTALAAQCLPYEMEQFDDALNELTANGHVVMYEVDGKKYLYLPTFTEHQKPHNTERPSKIPEFNGELTVNNTLDERESPTGKGKGKGKGSVPENKFSDDDLKIADEMFRSLRQINPKHKEPNLESWANTIRMLRERDKRTPSEIRQLWAWANNHDFWQGNILSPDKLRKQWDKLMMQQKQKPREEHYVI